MANKEDRPLGCGKHHSQNWGIYYISIIGGQEKRFQAAALVLELRTHLNFILISFHSMMANYFLFSLNLLVVYVLKELLSLVYALS